MTADVIKSIEEAADDQLRRGLRRALKMCTDAPPGEEPKVAVVTALAGSAELARREAVAAGDGAIAAGLVECRDAILNGEQSGEPVVRRWFDDPIVWGLISPHLGAATPPGSRWSQ